jgi:hypothetical protein
MNPKYRFISLFWGFLGLAVLAFELIANANHFDPMMILYIAVPDMVFFSIAYKTYPAAVAERARYTNG